MTQSKEKIVVCGHYGASNIGDEAILLSLLQNLKEAKPNSEVTVLSYDPKNTKANYLLPLGLRSLFRGIFKGELWKTLKTIKECDKFILGGGGLFTDEKIFAVFLWGLHAFCALRYKKPLYMIGQSVGPLKSRVGKWIAIKAFAKAKMIYVRDSASKDLLVKLGINREIIVAPDLVFGLKTNDTNIDESVNKKIEQHKLNGYFLISLRPWTNNAHILYKNIDQVAGLVVDKYKLLPVFIPYQAIGQNDELLMHKIVDQGGSGYPFLIQKFDQDVFKVLSLAKNAKFTLGMRLHSIIFSIISNTSFVALSYSPKVKNLLHDLKLDEFIVENFVFDEILDKINKIASSDFILNFSELNYLQTSRNVILDIFRKI